MKKENYGMTYYLILRHGNMMNKNEANKLKNKDRYRSKIATTIITKQRKEFFSSTQ